MSRSRRGFVLMELVVIVAIMSLFMGLIVMSMLGSQRSATLVEAIDIMISDIQSQQTASMTGFTVSGSVPAGYGIHFESDRYVLFYGSSYSPGAQTNKSVSVKSPVVISATTFPGGDLIFEPGSGELSGYVPGQDSVTIHQTDSNSTKTLTLNKLGVIYDITQ